MLDEDSIFDAKNVGGNPVHCLEPRKSSVNHHEVSVGHDRPGLVFERRREGLDQIEQPVAARRDVSTVLDVVGGPELLGSSVVTLVE